MGQNCFMQTATWLVSRELTQAAGPWDTRLLGDDDGEYFCRVKQQSDGIIFIPEAKVYYREMDTRRLSHTGRSRKKQDALFLSIQLHIQYLLSMEDSERTRAACVRYLQKYVLDFSPERPDVMQKMQALASEFGGQLQPLRLSWKYAWIETLFGLRLAKQASMSLPKVKAAWKKQYDKVRFRLECRNDV